MNFRGRFQVARPGSAEMPAGADATPVVLEGPPPPVRRHPLRTHLLVLTLACTVPLMVAGSLLAYRFVLEGQARAQTEVIDRLRLMRIAVDLRLENTIEDLQVLANAPDLRDGNLARFREHAVEATRTLGGVATVLADRDGQQIVSTRLPPGAALPRRLQLDAQKRVLASGLPQVSDLVAATVDASPIITVEVPVEIDGQIRYVLTTALSPDSLAGLLRSYVPDGWIASIIDRNGILVARTADFGGNLIGQPTIPEVSSRLDEPAAYWIKTTSRSGAPFYSSFLKSQRLGWAINMALPREVIDGPVRTATAALIALGVGALLLSIVSALLAARHILRSLSGLRVQVAALGRGEAIPPAASTVSEFQDIERILSRVGDSLSSALHQKNVLIDEINHRVKNTLATVQAIARLAGPTASSVPDFVHAFEQRIVALSRAYNLLTESAWGGADLRVLVEGTVAPYLGTGRVTMAGPDVRLPPAMALAMAAALQELSTNAAKYGSLSTAAGTLQIAWTLHDRQRVEFCWLERGGPQVVKPTRRGFGTRMMEDILARDTGWRIELDYAPAGLRCAIVIDLGRRPVPRSTEGRTPESAVV